MLRSSDRQRHAGRGVPPLSPDGSLHDSPPAAFGPFRVLHQVGAGSLGPVFRAHDPLEGRLVAVKAFRLDLTPEQAAELAVELEDLAASQPRHPGMAAAISAGVEGVTPYLAQEYVAGEALDATLRQFGPPPPAEALTTLRRVADALDRAAGDGIHHGMLHPRDILVADGGEARVIDLGVAQALVRSGLRVPVRRPYSAPECVEGRPWGGAADIFSLGAIAYELITGRRLAGPGRPEVQAPALSPAAADQVGGALERALDPDPSVRYPSAADLVDALAPHLAPARRPARKRTRPPEEAVAALPLEAWSADEPRPARPAEAPEAPSSPEAAPLILDEPTLHAPVATGAVEDLPLDAGEATVSEPAAPAARWSSPTLFTPSPASTDRRPFLPLVLAMLVGVAAGFGWGYWTAYRMHAGETAETPAASAAPAAAEPAPETVRIDEPEVIGERGLPPPSRAEAVRPPAPAPARTAPAREPAPRAAAPPPARQAARPEGRLLVRSTPEGAVVRVDGRVRGRTPLTLRGMPLRVVRVAITRDGYQTDERRVALTAARPTVAVDARLVAEPPVVTATTGSLVVESRPAGAAVFVNGQQIGVTPLSLPELPPGTHRVRLELSGFSPWVTTAEVRAGERARVAASLERGAQ